MIELKDVCNALNDVGICAYFGRSDVIGDNRVLVTIEETELTFDKLLEISKRLDTTHINIIGSIDGGYYPGEETAKLVLEIWP